MSGSDAFLAPEILMAPLSFVSPCICKKSISALEKNICNYSEDI
jgi:hypothetical protein